MTFTEAEDTGEGCGEVLKAVWSEACVLAAFYIDHTQNSKVIIQYLHFCNLLEKWKQVESSNISNGYVHRMLWLSLFSSLLEKSCSNSMIPVWRRDSGPAVWAAFTTQGSKITYTNWRWKVHIDKVINECPIWKSYYPLRCPTESARYVQQGTDNVGCWMMTFVILG